MPQLPTLNEPGAALVQQSTGDVTSLANTGQVAVQAAGAIASSLMGDAKSASSRVQADVLRQIATDEEIAKKSQVLSKLFDLREAAAAMTNEMTDYAEKSGDEIDVNSFRNNFSQRVSEASQGLSKEQQLMLSQSSMQLLEGLDGTASQLNKKTKINRISQANDKADNDALKSIYRLDRIPTEEDLQAAIDQKIHFYQSAGFSGTALDGLISQTKQEYSDKYAQAFANLVMQSPVTSPDQLQQVQLPDGSTGLVTKNSVGAIQALGNLQEMSPEVRMKLAATLADHSEKSVNQVLQAQKEAFDKQKLNMSWLSGDLRADSKEAKAISNEYWDAASATVDRSKSPEDQFKDQLTNYFTSAPNASRLPEAVTTELKTAPYVNNPEKIAAALAKYDILKSDPATKLQLSSDLSGDDFLKLEQLGKFHTAIGSGSINDIKSLMAAKIEDPGLGKRAAAEFTKRYQSDKDLANELFGYFGGLKMRGDSLNDATKLALLDTFERGYSKSGGDADMAAKFMMHEFGKNFVVAPDLGQAYLLGRTLGMDSVAAYFPSGGTIGSDFQDTLISQMKDFVTKQKEMGNDLTAQYKLNFDNEYQTLDKSIETNLKLVPIANPLDKEVGVAKFNYVDRSSGQLVLDAYGVPFVGRYTSPDADKRKKEDAEIAAGLYPKERAVPATTVVDTFTRGRI